MIADAQGLKKRERVSSKRTIDKLFGGTNSRSLTSYPLRLVYQGEAADQGGIPSS